MAELVEAFRALGDETRQRILGLLEAEGELCVSDLGRHFELTQPAISHHLKILKQAGLVSSRKSGKEVHYSINAAELSRCCGIFFARFACCQPLLGSGEPRSRAKAKGAKP